MPVLALSPARFLALALLAGSPALAQVPSSPGDTPRVRRIELRSEPSAEVRKVLISRGLSTTFFFNTALVPESVELEGREYFQRVTVTEDMLTLILAGEPKPGEEFRLRVFFADGAEPASVDFLLVVHPSRAEQQVEVYRQPRAAESCREQAREAEDRAWRCEAELARVRAKQERPDGLLGLREAGLLDEAGVSARALLPKRDFTQPSDEVPQVIHATVYRARSRLALELELVETGTAPLKVARAELVAQGGARLKILRVWPPEPVLLGPSWQRLSVEAEWEGALPPGPYTLELWDADGKRRVTLQGVTFPD